MCIHLDSCGRREDDACVRAQPAVSSATLQASWCAGWRCGTLPPKYRLGRLPHCRSLRTAALPRTAAVWSPASRRQRPLPLGGPPRRSFAAPHLTEEVHVPHDAACGDGDVEHAQHQGADVVIPQQVHPGNCRRQKETRRPRATIGTSARYRGNWGCSGGPVFGGPVLTQLHAGARLEHEHVSLHIEVEIRKVGVDDRLQVDSNCNVSCPAAAGRRWAAPACCTSTCASAPALLQF